VPEQISHYTVLEKLGEGGMGEVYLAEDTRLDRKVALKILPSEFTRDPERVRRFLQEAKAVSALNHPNIITVYDVGESDRGRFIAMELVSGRTLRAFLADAAASGSLLPLGIQMARALAAAHAAGITHRDIKPENIMVRDDGYIKILDFGLARLAPAALGEDTATIANQTTPGQMLGTVKYMSPEQARGESVGAPSDVFSLGMVFYELAAGKPPFAATSLVGMLNAIIGEPPLPPRQIKPGLSPETNVLILKMLEKDPARRPSATEVADTLQWIERGAISAPPAATPLPMDHPSTSPVDKRPVRTRVLLTLAAAAIVAALGAWLYTRATARKPIESIAVLPFVNSMANTDTDFLSDGMAETLISSLSQVPNLMVKSNSSVSRYKGKDLDLPRIMQDLKVQAVLTGRVAERGDQLSLALELVDTRTENVIWSEQYNRKSADLIALQGDIAHDVATKLQLKLSGHAEQMMMKAYTANPEAYQLYLKGRFYWNKRNGDALKQAASFYQQAIDKDPGYALAYAGLAETYVLFPEYSVGSPKESLEKAKAAASRALALDDTLAEAHTALAMYLVTQWDWSSSEKEFRRAIELKPTYPTAHQWFATGYLVDMKHFDESIAEVKRAQALDPLSTILNESLGLMLFFSRRFDDAAAQLKNTVSLDPTFGVAHSDLGQVYFALHRYPEAIAELRKAAELNQDPSAKAYLAFYLAKSGQTAEASKLREQLKNDPRQVSALSFAIASLGLGEKDQALSWLEKSVEDRSTEAPDFAVMPVLDELRPDARFKALLQRMKLPQ
jgi:eukaryotic-like serine/threonine-protein kinase